MEAYLILIFIVAFNLYLYKIIIETREMIIDLRKDHEKLIEIVINTIKGEVDANNRK